MKFVDTNVLLYAISSDPSEGAKAACARTVLNEPDLALSVQVLQEFYVQATRPSAAAPVAHETAAEFLDTLLRFPVQEITVALARKALAIRERWRIAYWDAAIVAAAGELGCDTLYTEDLQHGQDFDGLLVTNPFRRAVGS